VGGPPPSPVVPRGFVAALKRHPIVCLAILTPGIPEYLSTSSSLVSVVTNPAFFLLQLAINVAQYTAGALLVREALLRWKKSWGTGVLLALAYGIAEEGLGDNTLFNSTHGADGVLGSFGRFAGVNWVWATGVLAFHVIYSIGIPILLLGLALPETRGRSFLGRRGIALALVSVGAAAGVEMTIVWGVDHFWLGWYLLGGSLAAIGLLVAAAHGVPSRFLAPTPGRPSLSSGIAFAIGFLAFPLAFVLEYGFTSSRVPPALLIGIEVAAFAVLFEYVRRRVGTKENRQVLVDLSFGFVLWLAIFGFLLTLGLPYTLPLIALAVIFFVRLRRGSAPKITDPHRPPPAT
jgi:hypothetical protein